MIKIVNSKNINTNPIDNRNVKVKAIEKKEASIGLEFKVGSKVKHKEEGLIGEIKFIGAEKLSIVWDDNTRERIGLEDALNELEYVDDIQTLVAPTTPQISKEEVKEEKMEQINKVIEAGLNMLDEDETSDDLIEDGYSEKIENVSVDVEKIKLQRKVDELQDKLTAKKTGNMKDKIAKELVSLAVSKGMIEADDEEIETQKILMMDDTMFESYKQSVIDFDDGGHSITSDSESLEPDLSEAEKALRQIQKGGGKGIIGDFSREMPSVSSAPISSGSGERRALSEIRDKKYTFADAQAGIVEPSFEEVFNKEVLPEIADALEVKASRQTELPGFENIQGLKKPLNISNKSAAAFPTNSNLKDLFGEFNWTVLSK